MHTKIKGEKDTNKNKCNQKKKMITKIMKGPRCTKSIPHTLNSLSSIRSKKKTMETRRNGGKRSAILLCPKCKQTIV
jgi:hypothetical protein